MEGTIVKSHDLFGSKAPAIIKSAELFPDKPKVLFKPDVGKQPPIIKTPVEFKKPPFEALHPNWYGVYGAALTIAEDLGKFGHFKYADPYEVKKLMNLPEDEMKRQLMQDTLEDVMLIGGERMMQKLGQAAEVYTPKIYSFLTKARELPFKQNKFGARVIDLIGKRRADIEIAGLESEAFIRDIERKFTTPELEAIPFLRQGIKDPNVLKQIGREDLIPIINKPSKELTDITGKIGDYYDDAFKFLQEHWGDVGFVEDYVTHIWDIPKARKHDITNYFSKHNPFLKKRTIPTLEEGIKLGLKPKTTNIAELLRIYDSYKIKTAYNMEFAKELTNLIDDEGNKLILRGDKAPEHWKTIDHPALQRAMPIGKTADENILLMKRNVKVHPDIEKEVKIIFDKPFSHGAIRALETVNAFSKKGMLSLSLFHHQALTESAMASGIGMKAATLWNPKRLISEMRTGNFGIFKEMPLAKDALEHGVVFGALPDVQRGIVNQTLLDLENAAKNVPIGKTVTKVARKANQLWDTALWDYYHNTLKLWAYEENVEKGLRIASKRIMKKFGREMNIEEITATKKEMASFVNDSFGGQNWELSRIFGNPKMRQMLHWVLLAPDWTFSVLKQAAAPAKGAYQIMAGKPIQGEALLKRGALFWAKAGINFNIIGQSVNYYNTKKEYGEGRFTWQNAPGHELNIFIGRNKDGTERYLRMGKQFREVLEWGIDPLMKVGAKLSPVLRETIRQVSKHDPGSGYPTPWAEEDWWSLKGLRERGQSILEMPLPFSLRPYIEDRPGVFMFTFPTSKGMTNYKSVELFKEAIKEKNKEHIKRIFVATLENNLDAESLFKSAASSIKADITFDNKKMAKEIYKETQDLHPDEIKDALTAYKERGILTPEIYLQYLKLAGKDADILEQKAALGIKGGSKIKPPEIKKSSEIIPKKPEKQIPMGKYNHPMDVREAFGRGDISEKDAELILKKKFGME